MEKENEIKHPSAPEKPSIKKISREMIFLAEQSSEGGLKILPGEEWAIHHPVDSQTRADKLQGLLDGRYTADDVAQDIKPDALIYNTNDIGQQGLQTVSARIRDLSSYITYFDHPRFARFIESMRGRDIPLEDLDRLYSDLTRARIQKKMIDAYGHTGRQQIQVSLILEAESNIKNIKSQPRAQKIFKALKTGWIADNLGLIPMEKRDQIISELSGDERELYEKLQQSYMDYVQSGDENGYQKLINNIRDGFPKLQRQTEDDYNSESMEQLQEELDPFMDQAKSTENAGDLSVPPDDQDELYTSTGQSLTESGEKQKKSVFFEITPPLNGYYRRGVKSYYDIGKKTWSKKKKLQPYTTKIEGDNRHTIHGKIANGIKAIPLPASYAIDAGSVNFTGSEPKISIDQNGCFYIETTAGCEFSMDFLQEPTAFESPPIPDDLEQMYRGQLSPKTETLIGRLMGSNINKAEQVRQYILANHFYPGGGDLKKAIALQLKLLSESNGDNYVQNLDKSEYLECRSANTLAAAILRKSGVPTRFIVGDHVEGSEDNKSIIDNTTGHAWLEIWDGTAWRRFDATPQPKPEDKKVSDKEEGQKKDQAPQAQDGGIESPQKKSGEQSGGQNIRDNQPEISENQTSKNQQQSSESGNPLEQIQEAADNDIQQGESQLEKAKDHVSKTDKQKANLDQQAQTAEKFEDIDKVQKELENSELFDDQKKDLQKKLDAKTEQMKDKIEEELDKMVEDGFMDEKQRDEILEKLEKHKLDELDHLQKQIAEENKLYNEFEDIREEITPHVDRWFKYFAERLPKQDEISLDEDSLTRQGVLDRRSIMKPRNLLFGIVKNPRKIDPSIKPKFLASLLIDVSGSMDGDKLRSARKLSIFYMELFSRISSEFGYIRFSVNTFSDSVQEIKEFSQDYDSPQRYDFLDGTSSTIKYRIMKHLTARGGNKYARRRQKSRQRFKHGIFGFP